MTEKIRTQTRFETEAQENSEMAYWALHVIKIRVTGLAISPPPMEFPKPRMT